MMPETDADEATRINRMVALHIRWLPRAIVFFGCSFVLWTIIQVVTTLHVATQLGPLEIRLQQLELRDRLAHPPHLEAP